MSLCEQLTIAARMALKRCIVPLPERLKSRLAKDCPEYQFGFTGVKFNYKTGAYVGQLLVAIQVPDKPEPHAYWYINIPIGDPAPYKSGEQFLSIGGDLNKIDNKEFVDVFQDGINRLCKMLEAAY